MHRRHWMVVTVGSAGSYLLAGCHGKQFAKVLHPGDKELVGSHQAGQETFKPLVDEAVGSLLARHAPGPQATISQVSTHGPEPVGTPPMRICFVAVENKSAE